MRINLSDISIRYEDTGANLSSSQPTVLFIHGYPLNRMMWKPQLSELADSARLVAMDLRGFGGSDAPHGPYSMDMLAEDCLAFLDRLEITQPVILCGLSMGGYIAFSFYRKYPQRVQGLIFTATRASADSPEAKENRDKAIALANKEGTEAIARLMLPKMLSMHTLQAKPELVEFARFIMLSASVPGITGVLSGMRDRDDSTSLLPYITVPTLLIFGEDDPFVSRTEVDAMQGSIKNAILHWIPKAGHLPNLEQHEIFNARIREYLATFQE